MRISDDKSIFVWTTDLREEAMAVKKLQENIAISMTDESVYAIPNKTTGPGNLFPPRPSCLPVVLECSRNPSFTDRLTHSPIKVCEYPQCPLGEIKKKMGRLLSHTTARWTEDYMWPCVWLNFRWQVVRSGSVVMDGEANDEEISYSLLQVIREGHLSEIFIPVVWQYVSLEPARRAF